MCADAKGREADGRAMDGMFTYIGEIIINGTAKRGGGGGPWGRAMVPSRLGGSGRAW